MSESYTQNCIVECSQSLSIDKNNNSRWVNKLNESIQVKKGDTISCLNAYINVRGSGQDTIQIINNNDKVCSGKTRIQISYYKNANGINSVMCPYSWSIGALQNNQFYWDLDNSSSIIFSQDNGQDEFKVGSLNNQGDNTATITTNCRWNLVNYFDISTPNQGTAHANYQDDHLSYRYMKNISFNTAIDKKQYWKGTSNSQTGNPNLLEKSCARPLSQYVPPINGDRYTLMTKPEANKGFQILKQEIEIDIPEGYYSTSNISQLITDAFNKSSKTIITDENDNPCLYYQESPSNKIFEANTISYKNKWSATGMESPLLFGQSTTTISGHANTPGYNAYLTFLPLQEVWYNYTGIEPGTNAPDNPYVDYSSGRGSWEWNSGLDQIDNRPVFMRNPNFIIAGQNIKYNIPAPESFDFLPHYKNNLLPGTTSNLTGGTGVYVLNRKYNKQNLDLFKAYFDAQLKDGILDQDIYTQPNNNGGWRGNNIPILLDKNTQRFLHFANKNTITFSNLPHNAGTNPYVNIGEYAFGNDYTGLPGNPISNQNYPAYNGLHFTPRSVYSVNGNVVNNEIFNQSPHWSATTNPKTTTITDILALNTQYITAVQFIQFNPNNKDNLSEGYGFATPILYDGEYYIGITITNAEGGLQKSINANIDQCIGWTEHFSSLGNDALLQVSSYPSTIQEFNTLNKTGEALQNSNQLINPNTGILPNFYSATMNKLPIGSNMVFNFDTIRSRYEFQSLHNPITISNAFVTENNSNPNNQGVFQNYTEPTDLGTEIYQINPRFSRSNKVKNPVIYDGFNVPHVNPTLPRSNQKLRLNAFDFQSRGIDGITNSAPTIYQSDGGIFIETFIENDNTGITETQEDWDLGCLWDILGFNFKILHLSDVNLPNNRQTINTDYINGEITPTNLSYPITSNTDANSSTNNELVGNFNNNIVYKLGLANPILSRNIVGQSSLIIANNLSKKEHSPYILIISDILSQGINSYWSQSNTNLSCISTCSLSFESSDYFYSSDNLKHQVTNDFILSNITTELRDQNGLIYNTDGNSSVIYLIERNINYGYSDTQLQQIEEKESVLEQTKNNFVRIDNILTALNIKNNILNRQNTLNFLPRDEFNNQIDLDIENIQEEIEGEPEDQPEDLPDLEAPEEEVDIDDIANVIRVNPPVTIDMELPEDTYLPIEFTGIDDQTDIIRTEPLDQDDQINLNDPEDLNLISDRLNLLSNDISESGLDLLRSNIDNLLLSEDERIDLKNQILRKQKINPNIGGIGIRGGVDDPNIRDMRLLPVGNPAFMDRRMRSLFISSINDRLDELITGNRSSNPNTNRPDIRTYAEEINNNLENEDRTYNTLNKREKGKRNNRINNVLDNRIYNPSNNTLRNFNFEEDMRLGEMRDMEEYDDTLKQVRRERRQQERRDIQRGGESLGIEESRLEPTSSFEYVEREEDLSKKKKSED